MHQHIAMDLDGTILKYHGHHEQMEDPIPGALEFIKQLFARGHSLTIFTARTDFDAVKEFLRSKGFPDLSVTNVKSPAFTVFIDDRVLSAFNPDMMYGDMMETYLNAIDNFQPWWKKG